MQCPRCQHQNLPGAKFCVECAAPLAVRCPACGTEAPPTAKFCPECAGALRASGVGPQRSVPARQEPTDPQREGERRQLTVLFCDLVRSPPLSQQLDAEECRDVIAQYQEAAVSAVARFGGHVARKIGDGLLTYFGWPTAREDDPERAVRAGLAIVEGVKGLVVTELGDRKLDPTRTPDPLIPNALSVRVGMHTGPVVIADGDEVFGETPNIAARVQTAADPDTVVISDATQRLVA